jgi:hypothetical protein
LPLVGLGIDGNVFLNEPNKGLVAPEGWVSCKSTSSEDSDEDEHDVNVLFRMGLLDALLLEVPKSMGLSNITNHNIFKQRTSWISAIGAFIWIISISLAII